jgi:hypothetical protein
LDGVKNIYYKDLDKILCIELSQNGPTSTITIFHKTRGQIEVDVVPIFTFPIKHLDKHPRVSGELHKSVESFFVVPKDAESQSETWKNRYWRLDYHEAEQNILGETHFKCALNVIKLFKRFRDCNLRRWNLDKKILSSYALKTVVMLWG